MCRMITAPCFLFLLCFALVYQPLPTKSTAWRAQIPEKTLGTNPRAVHLLPVKLQLHDAIYRLRFYSNSFIHILSLSNSHNNVASMQKNRGDKSHRVIVALLKSAKRNHRINKGMRTVIKCNRFLRVLFTLWTFFWKMIRKRLFLHKQYRAGTVSISKTGFRNWRCKQQLF